MNQENILAKVKVISRSRRPGRCIMGNEEENHGLQMVVMMVKCSIFFNWIRTPHRL